MFFSKKFVNHLICDCCASPFPEAWVANKKAVRDGREVFCSPYCHSIYQEHTVPLPIVNGVRVTILNRRFH